MGNQLFEKPVRPGTPGSVRPEAAERRAANAVWAEVSEQLERVRKALAREIRSYPPPIAGCDQQFNLLLERRDRVTEELGGLASLRGDGAGGIEDIECLREFIGASACLDDELKARLLAPDLEAHLKRRDGSQECFPPCSAQ